jgi:hypothetical protein
MGNKQDGQKERLRTADTDAKSRQEPKDHNDGPIWKEGPFLFGILLFPTILLLCLILYWIQVFILKR